MSETRQLCGACGGEGIIFATYEEPRGCDECRGKGFIIATDTPTTNPLPPLAPLPTPNELAGYASCDGEYCTNKLVTPEEQQHGECLSCALDGPPCLNGFRSFGWLDCECDKCVADQWAAKERD